ncbi:MAG TPA: MotA/TolQ/ExbB proton channel family protein [bacterium]|nr:MotA/TolQ/ExbB proton channel family protein [bacterium]
MLSKTQTIIAMVILFVAFIGTGPLAAQQDGEPLTKIHIADVNRDIHSSLLGIPKKLDLTLYWKVYEQSAEGWTQVDPQDAFQSYEVLLLDKEMKTTLLNSGSLRTDHYTFSDLKVGQGYGFVVRGVLGGRAAAHSDTVWAVTGKLRADAETKDIKWHHWLPLNGRIPLAVIGRERFFDEATNAGKMAFHTIWNFFLLGLIIWFFFIIPTYSLRKVFPLRRSLYIGKGYDKVYQLYELPEFRNILEEWREIIKSANENIRQEIENGEHVSISEIAGANTKFWRDRGSGVVGNLVRRISLPKMEKYPAARIIRAGLENHELGGFHWMEVSKEVDRAIENRASSELEILRRKSLVDWLWNLGTLAPLIGLFGTATGISHAFAILTFLKADITQTQLVKQLAGGIYEALWTTIFGLSVGIVLTLLYYFYQNKLNWIYSKWEEIYVYVAEKL